jgi:hypothetical protein
MYQSQNELYTSFDGLERSLDVETLEGGERFQREIL